MKRIWMTFIAVAVSASFAASAIAQSAGPKNGQGGAGVGKGQGNPQRGQGGMRMGGKRLQEEVFAKLNLTAQQKQQITALQTKFQKEMESLRPKTGQGAPPSQADREKMMAKFKAHNEAVMKVLTPAQRTKFDALMKELREKMRKQRGAKPPAGSKPPAGGKSGGKPPVR